MGVQSLWTLLEPCGRRVNIEALTNKKLAVDASIWIFQFMQTMRDSRGEMLRNAHILGFFRRICRLLFHRVRPIFVFDGATPPLKRRTTIARRRRREQQTAKLRKTAEKLLMAQLKKHALQLDTSLKDDEEQAGVDEAQPSKERPTASEQTLTAIKEAEDEGEMAPPDTAHDAILARQLAEELEGGQYAKEMMGYLEAGNATGIEELTRRAATTVVTSPAGRAEEDKVKTEEGNDDEDMDDDDGNDDEEVVVPEGIDMDPAVLSTLPPSMQLDLMAKIRDNKIYENRARFQEHAAQPLNFSSFQIQEYLKASAFRRQIEGLKDTMNASVLAGVEGAVARRIAADEGREYILQREEPDRPESPKAATPASEKKPGSNGDALEISFELPGQKKINLDTIILNSPEQQKTSSSEEEWLDVDTGEPASTSKGKKHQDARSEDVSPDSEFKKPKDWRERKAQRQKYWSVSQGFRFGRKLAEWGEDAPARPGSGHTGSKDGDEDLEMQEAIRRSLMDTPTGEAGLEVEYSDNEGDQVWQGVPPPDQAGPSGSLPAANGSSAAHAVSLAARGSASPSALSRLPAAKPAVEHCSGSRTSPVTAAASSKAARKRADDHTIEQESRAVRARRAEGGAQRARKKIKLPTLAEEPLKESAAAAEEARANQKANSSVPLSNAANQKEIRLDTSPNSPLRPAIGTAYQEGKKHQSSAAPAKPSDDPVAAALRQALTNAEDEASDDSSSTQEEQASPSRQARLSPAGSKQPASVEHPARPDAGIPSSERSEAEPPGIGTNSARSRSEEDSMVAAQHASTTSTPTIEESRQSMPEASTVKEEQTEKPPGSIAFTGPVQDVAASMPSIPRSLTAGITVSEEQPKGGRPRPVQSDATAAAERAAEAEEEMRADLERKEQQELPKDDGPCADPWAEDPWGQGNLWEDPGAGLPPTGPPPVASGQPITSTNPKARQPAHEQPVAAAFNMDDELLQLEQQTKKLKASHRKQVGTTESPTTDMYGDCQELLQLFGLPYIIAPAEAEAQCAWLDAQGLVDGVVTDDNDAFLFGAKHIYRHIFEGRKYVEEYHTSDVERELGMDRLGLICLALLLGSDYTEGVAGIGIVNAVEVVQAFKGEGGMKQFREWVMNPDEEELREAAQPKPKRGCKQGADTHAEDTPAEDAADENQPYDERALREFKRSHRQMRRNWDLPSKFPDIRVIDAYRKPSLDESKERFTYGRPDAQLLRNFCLEKFGWDFEKVDQILDPVLKAYDARQSQATMDSFLAFNERFAKIRSKRLQQAVKGISKAPNPEMMEDYTADTAKPAGKRSKKGKSNSLATTPGSNDAASQLGVFADRSESDEELLAALTPASVSTAQRGRGKGQRARGSGRKATAVGGRAERDRGKGGGRSRKGRGVNSELKELNPPKPPSQDVDVGDDDVDWEPAS